LNTFSKSSELSETNKVASILFVDIVRSTELIANNKPDKAREFIKNILATIQNITNDFDGEIIKTQGDGAKIVFGFNTSMEDHAERAAYAAIKIIRESRKSAKTNFPKIGFHGIRAGLHSGYVIMTQEHYTKEANKDTFGLTTHIAAKLQASAPIDHLCLSEDSQKLIADNLVAKRHRLVSVGNEVAPVASFTICADENFDLKPRGNIHDSYIKTIGRKTELDEIAQILDFEKTPTHTSLLICGEAGLGKSRIIEDISFDLSARAIKKILIKGLPVMETTPFFAIQQILKNISLNDYDLEEEDIKALSLLKSMDLIAMQNWRLGEIEKVNSLSKATLKILRALLVAGPLVLIAEDLHFFDEESLGFFKKTLNFAKDQSRLRIIGTTRLPVPQNLEVAFDSYQFLRPLPNTEAKNLITMLSESLSLDVNLKAAKNIVLKSGGNPLAITELTKLEFSDSQKSTKPNIPVSIEPILRKRIEYLSSDARILVNYLSLFGRPIPLSTIIKLTQWNEEHLLEVMLETTKTGILQNNDNNQLEFGHDLYRIVCAENLTDAQRKFFHSKIYSVLSDELEMKKKVPDLQMLARHAFRAGHQEEGLKHFKDALSVANNIGGIRTVRNLFMEVCDYCDFCQNKDYHKARFAMLSFDATQRLGEEKNLLDIYLQALKNCKELFSPFEIIVLKSQLSIIYWTMGEAPKGLIYATDAANLATREGHFGLECITIYSMACLEFASGFLESSISRIKTHMYKMPKELAQKKWGQSVSYPSIVLQTFGAWFAVDAGKYSVANQFIQEAVKTEDEFPNTYGHVLLKLAQGYLYYRQKNPLKGSKVLLEAYEVAEKSALSLAPMSAAWAVLCLIELKDLQTAQTILEQEYKTGRYDIMRNANRGYFFLAKAMLLAELEQYEDAKSWLNKAIKDTSAKGDLTTLAYCHAAYSKLSSRSNTADPEKVRHLTKALEIANECGMKPLAEACEKELMILIS